MTRARPGVTALTDSELRRLLNDVPGVAIYENRQIARDLLRCRRALRRIATFKAGPIIYGPSWREIAKDALTVGRPKAASV